MKRLYRSRRNRVLGGICGGIGDYLEVDPVLIRLIWGVLFLFGGIGLIAYLIAWIVIPERQWEPETGARTDTEAAAKPNYMPQVLIGLFLIIGGAALLAREWWYLDQIIRDVARFGVRYLIPAILIGLGIRIMIVGSHDKSDNYDGS